MKSYKIFVIILGLVFLLSLLGFSATIYVPGDQPNIQDGINASFSGDTVLVAPEEYMENINFNGKGIVLLSFGGRDITTIVSASYGVPVVLFNNAEDSSSVLDGFTIDGASHSPGIHCVDASPILQNCDVSYCYGTDNLVGIFCDNSAAKVRYNLVHHNYGTGDGAGIVGRGTQALEISHNEVYNNDGFYSPGIAIAGPPFSSNVNIHHNLVRDNTGASPWVGGIHIVGIDCKIINNTIIGNKQGITIINGTGIIIRNNIVVSNEDDGIIPGSADVDYNDIWNNGSANDPGSNGISLDPEFFDESNNDFNLLLVSPCVDAGDPDTQYNDPDGTRNDMGAFPLGGSQPNNFPIPININLGPESRTNVINHTPTIYWTFYDTTRGQAAYELEVGTDDNWTIAEMWATGEIYSADTFAIYAGLILEDGAIYYYRIRVNNGTIWGSWQYKTFRMNSLPSLPIPIYPISQDYVNYQGVTLAVRNSNDLENDSLTYDFEIYSDPGLTVLAVSRYDVEEGNDSTWSGFFEGLAIDTEYWWRSRSYDMFEYSEWSSVESFLTLSYLVLHVPGDYPTIQSAINVAVTDDSVLVAPGTYVENINFLGKKIVVTGTSGADSTIIRAAYSDASVVSMVSDEPDGTEISGFTITGSNSSGVSCYGSSATIKDNIITGNYSSDFYDGAGIKLKGNTNSLICNNIIHSNFAGEYIAAISMGDGIESFASDTICYNLIYNNSGYSAIEIRGEVSDCIIANNTISVTGHYGIYGQGAGPHYVRNNIVFGATICAISGRGGNLVAEYNCTFGNTTNYDFTPGVGNIYLDAMFVDSANDDYNLQPSSPCIDAGDPDPQFNDPDGTPNDIGAFPFVPSNYPIPILLNLGGESQSNVINHTPTFYWTFHDTTRGQVAYEIEVGIDDDWSIAEMWAIGEVYSADTSAVYAGSTLEDGITYYLRIRVSNGVNWGDWKYWTFRMNSVPLAPLPIFPVQQQSIPVNSIQLVVENPNDPESDILKYDFEIYRDPGLSTVEASQYNVSEGVDSTFSGLFTGTTVGLEYWWRSRSFDSHEYSVWSSVESFVVDSPYVINVPSDHPTIQAAIYASENGAMIAVAPGTYIEDINFIDKNIVVTSYDGPESTILLGDIVIHMNASPNTQFSGFSMTGEVYISNGSVPCICDNIFHGCTGEVVISCEDSDPLITRNLFYNNGGISCVGIYSGSAHIINNTFDNNARGFFTLSNGIALNNIVTNSAEYGIAVGEGGTFSEFDYNNVWNNNPNYFIAIPGSNDLSVNPLFDDPAIYDYTLQAESPCINAGDPSPKYNDPNGTRNDMGAYWYTPDYICGDANSDYLVNIFDVTFLISFLYKGGPAPEALEAADVNNDGLINIFDVTYLVSFLYKSGPEPVCP